MSSSFSSSSLLTSKLAAASVAALMSRTNAFLSFLSLTLLSLRLLRLVSDLESKPVSVSSRSAFRSSTCFFSCRFLRMISRGSCDADTEIVFCTSSSSSASWSCFSWKRLGKRFFVVVRTC
jgi:hypothetical protein